jgi:long-chain acyl-CoA synthetase
VPLEPPSLDAAPAPPPPEPGLNIAPPTDEALPLGRTIARLSRVLDNCLTEVGMSASQYRLLSFLSNEAAASAASRLADKMSVTRPTITALVDGLVAKGWVERQVADDDRRRVDHKVTAAGREALAAADEAIALRLAEALSHLEPPELGAAVAGLGAWATALDRNREARMQHAKP